jgi:hypothetical protein
MSSDHSSDDRDPLERLAEEFVARHRRGEGPSPIEYAERYPQLAQRIHALFPAVKDRLRLSTPIVTRSGPSGSKRCSRHSCSWSSTSQV